MKDHKCVVCDTLTQMRIDDNLVCSSHYKDLYELRELKLIRALLDKETNHKDDAKCQ